MYGNAFGRPRYGRPKTDVERLRTHYALTGETTLPQRGTRIQKQEKQTFNINIASAFMGAVMGYTLYPAFKGSSVKTQFILGIAVGYIGYAVMHGQSLADMFKIEFSKMG